MSIDALLSAGALRYFHLGSSTSLESIEPLASCPELKSLGLENIKRITELDPIGGLTRLEGLAVEGSTWTTQHVDALEPIGRLTELRYLSLANLRARDGSLRSLFSLRKLERFNAASWWDEGERQELLKLNPAL
jgi:Leucine-rich repeat (LRR) protein